MPPFETRSLNDAPVVEAPDGSNVHILPSLKGGSMAGFSLDSGIVAKAVVHKTVEEIWFVRSGTGAIWRKLDGIEQIVELSVGVSITIPCGCHFQFRSEGTIPLEIIAITMPPWPGPDEAGFVEGPWESTSDKLRN